MLALRKEDTEWVMGQVVLIYFPVNCEYFDLPTKNSKNNAKFHIDRSLSLTKRIALLRVDLNYKMHYLNIKIEVQLIVYYH